MEPEVRYWMCRPDQIVARRRACPVVYVPIGTNYFANVSLPAWLPARPEG